MARYTNGEGEREDGRIDGRRKECRDGRPQESIKGGAVGGEMDGLMDGRTDGGVHGRANGWTDGWRGTWMGFRLMS